MPKYCWPDNKHSFLVYHDVLIPGDDGCPRHTKGCTGLGCPKTCYCQDRCTWERCTLSEPPHECLRETNSTWQQRIEHWTAKSSNYLVFDSLKLLISYIVLWFQKDL